jgi:hypothetical protein
MTRRDLIVVLDLDVTVLDEGQRIPVRMCMHLRDVSWKRALVRYVLKLELRAARC